MFRFPYSKVKADRKRTRSRKAINTNCLAGHVVAWKRSIWPEIKPASLSWRQMTAAVSLACRHLDAYKSQQSVERGFRFLKSPDFLTSSLFLKKPECIETLLMVMTCSLMIYAALELRIRTALKEQDQYFPDIKKKPSQNPTARWVFLCFTGIHEVSMGSAPPMITDIQERQQTIIDVLGKLYRKIYS